MKRREEEKVHRLVVSTDGRELTAPPSGKERSFLRPRIREEALWVSLLAGHEGVSTGRLGSGHGTSRPAKKFWSRERIKELAARLLPGTPVFVFHQRDRRRRCPVGEVVAAREHEVNGRLAVEAEALIRDTEVQHRLRKGELDTCSVEAEVECHRDSSQQEVWLVDAVRKVTGLALGNSQQQPPGFAGARILAVAEEFSGEKKGEESGGESPSSVSSPPGQLSLKTEAEESHSSATPSPAGSGGDILSRLAAQMEELRSLLAAPERQLAHLRQTVSKEQTESAPPGIAAPPERPRGRGRDNPLIPGRGRRENL